MVEGLSFEEALAALEQVVKQLESGEKSLDESLELFGRGMALARHCQVKLDEAEAKIEQLLESGGVAPFEPEA